MLVVKYADDTSVFRNGFYIECDLCDASGEYPLMLKHECDVVSTTQALVDA